MFAPAGIAGKRPTQLRWWARRGIATKCHVTAEPTQGREHVRSRDSPSGPGQVTGRCARVPDHDLDRVARPRRSARPPVASPWPRHRTPRPARAAQPLSAQPRGTASNARTSAALPTCATRAPAFGTTERRPSLPTTDGKCRSPRSARRSRPRRAAGTYAITSRRRASCSGQSTHGE